MTLIAFATYGTRAELITDTLSYTNNASSFGQCSKHILIPHLDAAVMSQGDSEFGVRAKVVAMDLAGDVPTFDALSVEITDWLVELWGRFADTTPVESTVFLIGYSHEHGKFAAYHYASEQAFKRVRVTSTFVTPTPWTARPSGLELRRLRDGEGRTSKAARLEVVELLKTKAPPPPPASIDEWVHLAQTVREQRALQQFCQTLVAGKVIHTRLERGESQTRTIHEFDDSGDEFRAMVTGSQHPVGQLMACDCGSGKTYRDCCLATYYADGHPCDCGSGQTFDGCCRVVVAQAATSVGSVV